jgi:hypothetical protein
MLRRALGLVAHTANHFSAGADNLIPRSAQISANSAFSDKKP